MRFIRDGFFDKHWNFMMTGNPVPWVALVLVALAALLLVEAVAVFVSRGSSGPPQASAIPAAA